MGLSQFEYGQDVPRTWAAVLAALRFRPLSVRRCTSSLGAPHLDGILNTNESRALSTPNGKVQITTCA